MNNNFVNTIIFSSSYYLNLVEFKLILKTLPQHNRSHISSNLTAYYFFTFLDYKKLFLILKNKLFIHINKLYNIHYHHFGFYHYFPLYFLKKEESINRFQLLLLHFYCSSPLPESNSLSNNLCIFGINCKQYHSYSILSPSILNFSSRIVFSVTPN